MNNKRATAEKQRAVLPCHPYTTYHPVLGYQSAKQNSWTNAAFLQTWEPLLSLHVFIWSAVLSLLPAISTASRQKNHKLLKGCLGENGLSVYFQPQKSFLDFVLRHPAPYSPLNSDWLRGLNWPTFCMGFLLDLHNVTATFDLFIKILIY